MRTIISTGEHEWPIEQRVFAHVQQFAPRRRRDRFMPYIISVEIGVLAAIAVFILEHM